MEKTVCIYCGTIKDEQGKVVAKVTTGLAEWYTKGYKKVICTSCNKYKTIICVECGDKFDFTTSEHSFYSSKGLAEPKRCPNCRKARKEALRISKGGSV